MQYKIHKAPVVIQHFIVLQLLTFVYIFLYCESKVDLCCFFFGIVNVLVHVRFYSVLTDKLVQAAVKVICCRRMSVKIICFISFPGNLAN